jgi:hypothetical protein
MPGWRVLWFWGHEHRLAGYGLQGTGNLKSAADVLAGGMPVDLDRRRGSRIKFL